MEITDKKWVVNAFYFAESAVALEAVYKMKKSGLLPRLIRLPIAWRDIYLENPLIPPVR